MSPPVTAFPDPILDADDLSSLQAFWRFYEAHASAIQDELLAACERLPTWAPLIRAMTPAQREAQNRRSIALQRAAILDGNWEPYLADLHEQGKQYARGGTSFASWFEILALFRNFIRKRLTALAVEDLATAQQVGNGMTVLLDTAMSGIGEAYLATKEQIIRDQQEAIREISTPVLQVKEHLLIIPVVGVVDTHRARLLTEALLRAIRDRRATGVVMDITGVPIVDSKVANHLAQACEAARLMGAIVVITGISSEIAQTLVTIGAELRGVRTVGDLQGGIQLIERILARAGGVPSIPGDGAGEEE